MWIRAQRTASSASARSMSHGVWPPLTAMTKRPRSATAVRASEAISSAALWAAASASATTSICTRAPPIAKNLSRAGLAGQRRLCCCGHAGIVPPSAGRNALIGLRRTPVSWLVFEDRRAFFQHRIDDAPGLLDVIFPGEQGGVSLQRIPKDALVSVHLVPARLIDCEEF